MTWHQVWIGLGIFLVLGFFGVLLQWGAIKEEESYSDFRKNLGLDKEGK